MDLKPHGKRIGNESSIMPLSNGNSERDFFQYHCWGERRLLAYLPVGRGYNVIFIRDLERRQGIDAVIILGG